MGIIRTVAKVAAGTAIAKKAIDLATDKLSSVDINNTIKSLQTKTTCYNCGCNVDKDAKFCSNCGATLIDDEDDSDDVMLESDYQESDGEYEPTRSIYDASSNGDMKCPNCGALIDSFSMKCPYCGYAVSTAEAETSSVKDLTNKIAKIDAKQFVWHDKKKSALEGAIGMVMHKDEKEAEEKELARHRFESQKEEEKKSLILNYPVPNTEKEILEFMLLASANINVKDGQIDEFEKIWITKMEQTYQRAQIAFINSTQFTSISNLYNQKMDEINAYNTERERKQQHNKKISFIILAIGLILLLIGWIVRKTTGNGNLFFVSCMLLMLGVMKYMTRKI